MTKSIRGCAFSRVLLTLLSPLLVGGMLLGCSVLSPQYSIRDMPPFQPATDVTPISPQRATQASETADILALSPDIIQYFERHVSRSMPIMQRVETIHRLLRSPAFLGIEYRNDATYTAREVFQQRQANCLAYANLFNAVARHFELKAKYQIIKRAPKWNRMGDVLAMNIHMNSVIRLPKGYQLEIDINRDDSSWQSAPEIITDSEALAQYYNNLAIESYASKDYQQAYRRLAQALSLDPQQALLWSNLGALYRINQQLNEAELAYKIALDIDGDHYTALNNLAILYETTGDYVEQQKIISRVKSARNQNPYYHYSLAKQALEENHLDNALEHIHRALHLKNDEAEFEQLLKAINYQLQKELSELAGQESKV